MSDELPAVLARTNHLVTPALRGAVDRLSPPMRLIAGYQLGWLAADGSPRPASGGKGVRGALALLSAEAAGRRPEEGVPAAVAVELAHNFSLLHDDLMDKDETRRHRPTAWTVFGSSSAILGGVAMFALAEQVLQEMSGPGWRRAAYRLTAAVASLVAGQAADLSLERRVDVTVDECLGMAVGKTASLLSCAASLGAVAVAGPADVEHALASYGHHLGMAFQLVDDLLGLWGDPERTGKPVMSDLRSGKRTLPMVAALRRGGSDGERLAELLAGDAPPDDETCALATKLIDDAGGRAWAQSEAQRRLELAEAAVGSVPMPEPARVGLLDIARFVVARDL
jgi:geranylgeranyl diphosphate synthase type I